MRICYPVRWILFFVIATNFQSPLQGQTSCSKTIFNPDADLTKRKFEQSDIKFRSNIPYRKNGSDAVAPDISYNDECGSYLSCSLEGSSLKYDMFYPKGHDYSGCALPVMILFHPGGLSDCSNKDNQYIQNYCKEFARRGFVAINLEYRRGVDLNETQADKDAITASQLLAIYRAVQDVRGAVRSVIARQIDNSFSDVRIDPENIFIGGAGTTILNAAYYTQEMFNRIMPGIEQSLGSIDEDYYYGSKNIPIKIKGVMNLWGGMFTPFDRNFANYFIENKDNLPPLISFHGAQDDIVPIEQISIYFLDSPFNSQKFCLNKPFTLNNQNRYKPDLILAGSKRVYEFFRLLGITAELYVDCGMNNRLSQNTGFGTGFTEIDSVQYYIVGRTASFFQAVVNNFAKDLRDSKFVDCANYRKGSFKENDNNGCKFSDRCTRFIESDSKFWESASIPVIKQPLFSATYANKILSVKMLQPGNTSAELYTYNGQKLRTIRNENGLFSVDFNSMQPGVYMLRVIQNGTMQTEKVLVR